MKQKIIYNSLNVTLFLRNQAQFPKHSSSPSYSLFNNEMRGNISHYKCPSLECSYLNLSSESYPLTKCPKECLK